jgi:hypothetical protein
MRAAIAAFALLALPAAAPAETPTVDRIEIVDRGVYEIVAGAETKNEDTPTGVITAVETEKLVTPGNAVAARVGLEFGFRYRIVGGPDGADVSLDMVYTYPAPGLKSPDTAAPITETRYSRTKKIGATEYLGYAFEKDWEIVPGTWTFAIWQGGKKLAEESFTVSGK